MTKPRSRISNMLAGKTRLVLFGLAASSFAIVSLTTEAEAAKRENVVDKGDDFDLSKATVLDLKARLETQMSRLGELSSRAQADQDIVQATCILDKQEQANDALEVATAELMIIRSESTSVEERAFSREKLVAAAHRVDTLVDGASICVGDGKIEDDDQKTANKSVTPETLPTSDPTSQRNSMTAPPDLDSGWLPVASAIE